MSTVIRSSISRKNKYYISKERYFELKHFCLQYNEWKDLLKETGYGVYPSGLVMHDSQSGLYFEDTTAQIAISRAILQDKMKLVKNTAIEADEQIGTYIFKSVTDGVSYTYLSSVMNIPCGKDMFYDRYRKFFWLLDKKRDSERR